MKVNGLNPGAIVVSVSVNRLGEGTTTEKNHHCHLNF